ncbi:VOC family protein [Ectopseudomonas hydrolytica]|uniref:VOC family protein n=1 Tax=Ectopseudomonas hydrolytica TaxID=2493633 RepID=UPI003EE2DC8D
MNNKKTPSEAPAIKTISTPKYIAHWVVKTARRDELIAWYKIVFGAEIVHMDKTVAFLSWDEESHRLALVNLPRFLRYLFPFSKIRRKLYGIDHIAFSFGSLEELLHTYARIKQHGIEPVWCINHGPTTSVYYEDPDGGRLEFQVDNFTVEETKRYFNGKSFADNPIGVVFDPDYLLERLNQGESVQQLLKQGAGTRPGTKQIANMKAINWRTL